MANPRLSFREHAVTDCEPVCAFGRYSAERGGLVPDPASIDPYPIRLRRGDGAAVRLALLKSAVGYSLGTVGMVAIAVGIALIAHLMVTP